MISIIKKAYLSKNNESLIFELEHTTTKYSSKQYFDDLKLLKIIGKTFEYNTFNKPYMGWLSMYVLSITDPKTGEVFYSNPHEKNSAPEIPKDLKNKIIMLKNCVADLRKEIIQTHGKIKVMEKQVLNIEELINQLDK